MSTPLSRFEKFYNLIRNGIFNLFLITVVGLVMFAALEGVARIIVHSRPKEDWVAEREKMQAYSYFSWREQFFKDIRHATTNAFVYQPYTLWSATGTKGVLLNMDLEGYRVTKNNPTDSNCQSIKLFMFGGSTTVCAEVPDEYTIASILARNLNESGRKVTVSNYGVNGFISDQEIVLLTQVLTGGSRPDIVIFYNGVNDTFNKVCKGQPHYRYENFQHVSSSIVDKFLPALKGYINDKMALLKLIRPTNMQNFITDPQTLNREAAMLTVRYTRNMAFVRHLAEGYGFKVFFFWQPNIFSTGKKLTSEEERIKAGEYKDCQPGYEMVKTHTVPALQEDNFTDLTDALDGIEQSIFVDFCHLTSTGNEAVAQRIFDRLKTCWQ